MTGKKIFKWLMILGLTLVIQTLTFYSISIKQLEGKLLPEYFQFSHRGDSAYVRDFYSGEDPPFFTALTHNLKNDQESLKQRLKVKYVYFEESGNDNEFDARDFNLVYVTWMQRGDWLTLSNFFRVTQVEEVMIDKTRVYKREAVYRWCLFFWIRTFEFIQSDDLLNKSLDD